jgi:hypothetical protein
LHGSNGQYLLKLGSISLLWIHPWHVMCIRTHDSFVPFFHDPKHQTNSKQPGAGISA